MQSLSRRFVPATLAASMWLCLAGATLAADAKEKKPEPPLFQAETPLAVTLQAPWADVMRNPKDPRRYPAVLSYGDAHRIDATIETRGITRLRICHFPPIRLRFEKPATQGTEFAGQEALKLVTHCNNGNDYYYVQELLAYRIYNAMTPQSFRARPLEITYRDSHGGKSEGPRFGFLIEDIGDMARRNGLKRDPRPRHRPADYDPLALSRLMLFEYLIGNTDWDVTAGPQADECCHNTRIFGSGDEKRIAVPYDFDSAGMVAASYAAPHESLPIKDVKQRLYRGFCVHNDALPAARAEYLAKKAAIMQLVEGETRLGDKRRKAVAKYVGEFYATLESDDLFAREITAKCRK